MLSCEIFKVFKNNYFEKHLQKTALQASFLRNQKVRTKI